MADGKGYGKFIWRITYSHVIAYFVAGMLALAFLDYKTRYATGTLALLMRPVESPITALGPLLQIARGLIVALVLLPIKDALVGGVAGAARLALLVLGLSAISTIGPSPGSFDGFIYTKIPVRDQLMGIPEILAYVLLFSGLTWLSYRIERKAVSILAAVAVALIAAMSVLGYLASSAS